MSPNQIEVYDRYFTSALMGVASSFNRAGPAKPHPTTEPTELEIAIVQISYRITMAAIERRQRFIEELPATDRTPEPVR